MAVNTVMIDEDWTRVADDMAAVCYELAQGGRVGRAARDVLLNLKARWDSAKRAAAVPFTGDDIPLAQRIGDTPLTPRQLEFCEYLHAYRREHGVSPTFEEFGEHFGIRKVSVFEHVNALQKKGVVRRYRRHASRSLVWCKGDTRRRQMVA